MDSNRENSEAQGEGKVPDSRDSRQEESKRSSDRRSVGSHKPGGDGPGRKKFKWEHDDRETRK